MATERDPELKRTMGTHLKKMLNERGWTQEHLAKVAGIDPGTLSQRIRGVNELKAGELIAIAEVFDVTIEELFPGDPPEERRGRCRTRQYISQ